MQVNLQDKFIIQVNTLYSAWGQKTQGARDSLDYMEIRDYTKIIDYTPGRVIGQVIDYTEASPLPAGNSWGINFRDFR